MHFARALIPVSFCLLVSPARSFAQASIELDKALLDLHGQAYVEFSQAGSYPIHLTASEREHLRPYSTDDRTYNVYVDFRKTQPTEPPTDIDYHIYTQPTLSVGTDVFTEYVVVGSPHGDFTDQWSSVKFQLKENGLHTGTIELPLHSPSGSDFITVDAPPGALKIRIAGTDHKVPFKATNTLKNFGAIITSAELTTDDDDNWVWPDKIRHSYSASFDGITNGSLPALRSGPVTGFFEVHPNYWQSLMSSTHTVKADDPSDIVTLTIRYNAELGGSSHATPPIKVKIHFQPPWWALLLSSFFGAIVGSLLTLAFPSTWKGSTWIRTLGSAALLALVAQVLGMLLFMSDNSNIQIAGFSLNPTEMLPSLGLGILVGLLGLKTFDAFKISLPTR
jgi:hypothetical protein